MKPWTVSVRGRAYVVFEKKVTRGEDMNLTKREELRVRETRSTDSFTPRAIRTIIRRRDKFDVMHPVVLSALTDGPIARHNCLFVNTRDVPKVMSNNFL